MRSWLAALAPWMVIAAAWGQARIEPDAQAVQVDFTFHGVSSEDSVRIDEEVYAAPTLLRRWGWEVETRYQDADVTIEGRTFRVGLVIARGRPMVNLSAACLAVGAKSSWSSDRRTMIVRSLITNVEPTQTGIRIDGTLPYRPRLIRIANPDRLVIDLEGADYDPTRIGGLPNGWRAGQLNDRVMRTVIEHPLMANQPMPPVGPGRTLQLALRSIDPTLPAAPSVIPTQAGGTASLIARITSAQLTSETPKDVSFALPIREGRPGGPVASYESPTLIKITIPTSAPDAPAQIVPQESSLVKRYELSEGTKGSTVLTIETTRPLIFDISLSSDGIAVRLKVPPASDGTLTGKVILIDPGHGGKDSGARWGPVNEKTIVLSIGNLLSQMLLEAGASVVRTRSDDRFVELEARADMANRNRVAAFVSIHVNSNTVAESASGTITFYHKQDAEDMLLAACIHEAVVSLKRLPNKGLRSDSTIYKSGFSVLRNADMPGFLLELGFINNSKDRKVLADPNFHRQAAAAIVRGLKVYFGAETSRS